MAQPNEFNLKAIFNEIVDVDILVELVQVRPEIWDKTAEGYRNREVSTSVWQQIYRIMFPNYDSLHAEQKQFIGKVIKDKWNSARDLWQRSHRKRQEAMRKGENVHDFKDNTRYEKLMFLAKLYNKNDHFHLDKKDNILDPKLGTMGLPITPKADPDNQNVPSVKNADFQRNFVRVLMNHKTPQKLGFNPPSKRRKLENGIVGNTQVKNEQRFSSCKPMALNFENKVKTSFPSSLSKNRTSCVNSRAIDRLSANKTQSLKSEQINPNTLKKEMPLSSNSQSVQNNAVLILPKVALKSPSQLFQENLQSSSNDNNCKSELIMKSGPKHEVNETKVEQVSLNTGFEHEVNEPKVEQIPSKTSLRQEVNKTKVEQTPSMTHSENNNSMNSDHYKFFQVLRPRIEDFSKTQIIDFFLEMLKPHIKDFDKHQLLDFQIETLQLVKKMEGN